MFLYEAFFMQSIVWNAVLVKNKYDYNASV